MILKHVQWESYGDHGLVVIKLEGWEGYSTLSISPLSGRDLHSNLIIPVLNATLPEDWMEKAEKLHRSRKKRWTVNCRHGMSGCCDYNLYILRDEDYLDQPRAAHLHESMAGKLNDVHCLLMDLPPLLAKLVQETPPAPEDSYYLRVWEPRLREGYQEPGDPSGFQEPLEALKAMEVMGE